MYNNDEKTHNNRALNKIFLINYILVNKLLFVLLLLLLLLLLFPLLFAFVVGNK